MRKAFLKVFGDDLDNLEAFVARLTNMLERVQQCRQAVDEQLHLLVPALYWPDPRFDPAPFRLLLVLMAHFDPHLLSPIGYDSQSLTEANTEEGPDLPSNSGHDLAPNSGHNPGHDFGPNPSYDLGAGTRSNPKSA